MHYFGNPTRAAQPSAAAAPHRHADWRPNLWRLCVFLLTIQLVDPCRAQEPIERPPAPTTQQAAPRQVAPNSGVAEPDGPQLDQPADRPIAADIGADQPDSDSVLQKKFAKALLIDVEGPIFSRFHWYLNQRLDRAQQQNVDLVILRLTSPGGDLEQSLQLARRLSAIDWATTVVYIPEEAISGGAIISLGCDRIYMQSGALFGDAGPIRLNLGGAFEHAEEKIVSYLVGALREIAASKGRPSALAEAMADRTAVVYQATELATGKQVYLSEKEFNEGDLAGKFKLGPRVPEAGQNRFLTVGADRALQLGLCEGVFASQDDLLQQMSIETLSTTHMQWVDKLVFTLNRPWVTGLLLILGFIGLYLELAAPGISFAGLSALFCFGIFFWSHALGGTAGWLEVLLFLLGVVSLACELFVLPGFGVFGISGLVLVVLSLVMASQDFLVPQNTADWGELRGNLLMVLGAVLGVMALFVGQILLLDSIPGLNRFRLHAPTDSLPIGSDAPIGKLLTSSISGAPLPPLGARAVAESDLRPSGKVKHGEQLLDVITEGDYIEAGHTVEILRIEGNRIVVRKV